jgi:hypothetical protein
MCKTFLLCVCHNSTFHLKPISLIIAWNLAQHPRHQDLVFSFSYYLSFLGVGWDWVHLVSRPLTGLLYQAWMIDECGEVGGMIIGRGNRSTRIKRAPVPLFPPQIPYDLTWARTRAAKAGRRWLITWAMARPESSVYFISVWKPSSVTMSHEHGSTAHCYRARK